ncbi:hypothetical protein TSTA_002790 [Talaromyces stipitatus ATCC 10500]|uniref:Uncharacterized protein n=1 Tax=Talaromyces stipitatus (strain ATCC 10500 / CBS 375.48 / QM 6759 / NRRL 1006) TaxID=441959 RepID=B8MS37_TALSN|nr:uncharacterized protein TSTA_002790 [Talaromyces stipitatus ATCC 10500]EED12215.1 hypothetical protein TSTA_002790 [Talaromyces stipitatus ATCC 10500]
MGCSDQRMICLPPEYWNETERFCTRLSSALELKSNLDHLRQDGHMNDAQYYTAKRIAGSVRYSTLNWIAANRGDYSLLASTTTFDIQQTVLLENDQWQAEMVYWLYTSFAYIQRSILMYAANYNTTLMSKPTTPWEQNMCSMQLHQLSPEYRSFSFLGVALIIGIGSIIIVINWFIDSAIALIWPLARLAPEHGIWTKKFQPQRLAFEGKSRGSGGDWTIPDTRIPRTVTEEKLGYYDD